MKGFLFSFYKDSSCVLKPVGFFVLFLVDYFQFLLVLCLLKHTLLVLLPNTIKSSSARLIYSG